MAIKDAGAATAAYTAGASAGQANYVAGVQATTKDPTALAVQAQAKLQANFLAALQSGRWARNLQAVGLTGWKSAVVAKAGNYATGIAAGATKYSQAYAAMLPQMQSLQAQIDGMPNVTIGDANARSAAWATGMRNWKLAQ